MPLSPLLIYYQIRVIIDEASEFLPVVLCLVKLFILSTRPIEFRLKKMKFYMDIKGKQVH